MAAPALVEISNKQGDAVLANFARGRRTPTARFGGPRAKGYAMLLVILPRSCTTPSLDFPEGPRDPAAKETRMRTGVVIAFAVLAALPAWGAEERSFPPTAMLEIPASNEVAKPSTLRASVRNAKTYTGKAQPRPTQYRFVVQKMAQGGLTAIHERPYSASSSTTWTPSDDGLRFVHVFIMTFKPDGSVDDQLHTSKNMMVSAARPPYNGSGQ